MKPYAVYLSDGYGGDGAAQIRRVYGPATRNALAVRLSIDDRVYMSTDLGCPELRRAELVFSTWGMPTLSEAEIRRYMPELKVLFYGAGSVQAFARPLLGSGVRIVSAWAANAVPVAEFTFAQIILANKGYFQSAALFKAWGNGPSRAFSAEFPGTFGCTVGIIGAGMVGRRVIEMLHACGARVKVLVYDPFLPDAKAAELGVQKCTLEELFEHSRTISNHLANNAQTKAMLGYALFSRMGPYATFINTGRGAQVAEADLARALCEFPGRTALLDVTEPEPPVAGHEFYTLPNVFLTGHIAGAMGDEPHRMGEYMLEELDRYLRGERLQYEVTGEMLATMA